MSEAVQIALIATIAPTVLAVAGIAVAWVNNRVANRKINEVHTLTNSTLSKANARIEQLEEQVGQLKKALGIADGKAKS